MIKKTIFCTTKNQYLKGLFKYSFVDSPEDATHYFWPLKHAVLAAIKHEHADLVFRHKNIMLFKTNMSTKVKIQKDGLK